jgi:hypothetical protein
VSIFYLLGTYFYSNHSALRGLSHWLEQLLLLYKGSLTISSEAGALGAGLKINYSIDQFNCAHRIPENLEIYYPFLAIKVVATPLA